MGSPKLNQRALKKAHRDDSQTVNLRKVSEVVKNEGTPEEEAPTGTSATEKEEARKGPHGTRPVGLV